jgi:hypothetical protein
MRQRLLAGKAEADVTFGVNQKKHAAPNVHSSRPSLTQASMLKIIVEQPHGLAAQRRSRSPSVKRCEFITLLGGPDIAEARKNKAAAPALRLHFHGREATVGR